MMTWTKRPGDTLAVGSRGLYTIQSLANGMHILQGIGHDNLPMVSLPSLGQVHTTVDNAKTHAETIDRTTPTEAHIGGE